MIERCDDCGHQVGWHSPSGCCVLSGCGCPRTLEELRPSDTTRGEPDAECEPFKAALCPHGEGRCVDCCEQCAEGRGGDIAEEAPTVYLVSEGSYSDYHIIAAFSNREAAEQFADEAMGGVEEYVLRDSPPPKATCYYRVLMPREGEGGSIIFETVEREEVHHVGIHRYTVAGEVSDEPPPIAFAATHEGMIRRLHSDRSRWPAGMGLWALVQVFGYDRERVEAAYRDRVAEVRARVEGIG